MFDLNDALAALRAVSGTDFLAEHSDAIAKVADGLDSLSDALAYVAARLADLSSLPQEPTREQMLDDLAKRAVKKYGITGGWNNKDVTDVMTDEGIERVWELYCKGKM